MRLVWPDYLIHLKWWPGAKTHATLFTKQAREGRWLVDTQSDNRTCHESQFDWFLLTRCDHAPLLSMIEEEQKKGFCERSTGQRWSKRLRVTADIGGLDNIYGFCMFVLVRENLRVRPKIGCGSDLCQAHIHQRMSSWVSAQCGGGLRTHNIYYPQMSCKNPFGRRDTEWQKITPLQDRLVNHEENPKTM